jgi:hypothetical protein
MVMSAVVATDETATLVVGAGSVDILGSSAVLVDSVAAERTVRAAVVPVLSDDSAAPIPRATAGPPIRPTYAPARMHMCLPPVRRTRPQLGRIGGHCVAWVSFHGDQPCQRHAESVGTVESPP